MGRKAEAEAAMNEKRRAMRDRAVLDHLTRAPIKPVRSPAEKREFDQNVVGRVDKAIHKRRSWRTAKGLAEF
jgi:hypothetical protein